MTAKQMRFCDHNTSEYFGMEEIVLMERAALAVADAVQELCAKSGGRILVLCGSGNNGADGYAAARLLVQRGFAAEALFCGEEEKRSNLNQKQHAIAERSGVPCRSLIVGENGLYQTAKSKEQTAEYDISDRILGEAYDLIVDALFGVGLTRPAEGDTAAVLRELDRLGKPVVAVDMPSGVNADNGSVMGCALHASVTVTFGFRKLGLVLYPGADYAGRVCVRDIGITKEAFLGSLPEREMLEGSDICRILPKRPPDSNKGTFGKILIMAGSPGMSGACTLAALAAYRAGAGMVRILTCEENREILQSTVPEALLTVMDDSAPEAEKKRLLNEAAAWADVIAAGPGLGRSPGMRERFFALYEWMCGEGAEKPLILDADALNFLSETGEPQTYLRKRKPALTVLTPHRKEFSALCAETIGRIQSDPIGFAEKFAAESGCILAAKDARTYVCVKTGAAGEGSMRGCVNMTGSDAMATAGSGDVLTGVIAAMAAVVPDLFDAVCAGVYLHGAAGEAAAERLGKDAVMASDLTAYLPGVMRTIRAEQGEGHDERD